jgi:hypothetical protein
MRNVIAFIVTHVGHASSVTTQSIRLFSNLRYLRHLWIITVSLSARFSGLSL